MNPDGQHEQAAAQLGGMARARYGEGAADGVPLPLRSDQVVGEGEAVHSLIRSRVRIVAPLPRSAWGSLRSVSCATGHPTPSRSLRRARHQPGARRRLSAAVAGRRVRAEPGYLLPEPGVIGQVQVPQIRRVAQQAEHAVEDVGLMLLELPLLTAQVQTVRTESSTR